MDVIDQLAEQRIKNALEKGELSGLRGEGKPLDLADEPLLDPATRMSNKILANAGFVPPELQRRNEIVRLRKQLLASKEPAHRQALTTKITSMLAGMDVTGNLADSRLLNLWYVSVRRGLSRN